jgi:hypothetical protein
MKELIDKLDKLENEIHIWLKSKFSFNINTFEDNER